MAQEPESEQVWDEYDWERFLKDQERRAEQYMELVERLGDAPDRDEQIAKEMGWASAERGDEDDEDEDNYLVSGKDFGAHDHEGEQWDLEEIEECDDDPLYLEMEQADEEETIDDFQEHPLYREAFDLAIWIDQLLDSEQTGLENPAAIDLCTQAAIASSKLAAGLCGEESEELGMSIAYLKRALHALNLLLMAADQLAKAGKIPRQARDSIRSRAFSVRDGIVQMIGNLRSEFRRRYPGH
ncbi:MAG: hypothetical protein SNJ52_01195 [Verrucomicrobiia bacterium]